MFVLLWLAMAGPPADLSAVGVVVTRGGEGSVALLRSGGRTRLAGVGDSAFGGRVAAITEDGVAVDFETGRVRVRVTAGDALPAAAAARPVAPAEARLPEDGRTLERQEVERRIGQEANRILAETTLVPAMDGGRVAGFTLSRVPEGTLLTDAGLRPGDVLTSVNDVPIDSMATLIGLWPRLQNERTVRAVVLRNGQPVTLAVTLR
jgi:general secretion pathway protein C